MKTSGPTIASQHACADCKDTKRCARGSMAAAAMAAIALASGPVQAQKSNYPNKPIRIIVPFAPGGGTDVLGRILTQKVGEAIGATIVVDNRGGSGGVIATKTIAASVPDGYTLAFDTASYTTRAVLYELPFDPVRDVTPIIQAFSSGYIMVVPPSNILPARSVKELIAYATANPGKINYGSSGVGTFLHLGTELFLAMANVKMNHVPYKGAGPALNDLMGGQIHLVLGSLTVAGPLMKANRMRGIAVTTAKRWPDYPDIPAVAETLPGYEAAVWYAMWGPRNLPRDIVTLWNREIRRAIDLPELKPRWSAEGVTPVGNTPEEFGKVLQTDIAKWRGVAKAANLKPESSF